jgi:signal transduction histidine kinase
MARSGGAAARAPWLRVPLLPTWAAAGQLLLAPATGTFWLVLGIVVVAAGIALSILWVGLPIVLGGLLLGRGAGAAERSLLATTLGTRIEGPGFRPLTGGVLRRLRTALGDPALRRQWGWVLLSIPLGAAEAVLVLAIWSLPLALLTMPLWYRWPGPGGAELFWWDGRPRLIVDTLPAALAGLAGGVLLYPVASALTGLLARGHATVAVALLGPGNPALAARVQTLQVTRARAMDAAAAERRRIERDLHDGAQARLLALAMDLGLAREKFTSEPDEARKLLDTAHDEAKRAMAELRDLARGIHPAVLTDRGLDAAISALAARAGVPVEVSVAPAGRLPEAVEVTAYYVVAEALVNVSRHAGANRAWVTVTEQPGRGGAGLAVVEVGDDGKGGAVLKSSGDWNQDLNQDLNQGGLAGLADRVAAIDGRLGVSSPPGGPTVVRAELPVLR